MSNSSIKISIFLVVITSLFSCNAVKHLEEDDLLLTENSIVVDGEVTKNPEPYSLLNQKPNPKTLGMPVGLHIYNLADQNPDSTYQNWLGKKPKREERMVKFHSRKQVVQLGRFYSGFNKWLQDTGNAPVIIEESKTNKSIDRLEEYYFSKGWFNVKASARVVQDSTKENRGSVVYDVTRYTPYILDSITTQISSPAIDSLFRATEARTFIKSGKQYDVDDFINERDRLNILFRNNGLYYFSQEYIEFDADTVNTGHKVLVDYIIPDRRITTQDSVYTEPFKVHHISDVRIVTDYSYSNRGRPYTDSIVYNGYKLYGYDEIKYRPKAITDAISIAPNSIFKDIDRRLTYNQVRDLRTFKYPNIDYREDPSDSTGTGLITTILLSPQKKYTLGLDFDAFTSTIQQFGIGFSATLGIRNVFRGAELLEISGSGSVGSSKDAADSESKFFNISDVGVNAKLSIPKILFPGNTDNWIPKYMSPVTSASVGVNAQNNIGLDRRNISSIFSYRWKPTNIKSYQFDLFNLQYVRNLNPDNYYNVYTSSYDLLNDIAEDVNYPFEDPISMELGIPEEVNMFIQESLDPNNPLDLNSSQQQEVLGIAERQVRLSEDNLIFATNFQWIRDTRQGLADRSFSRLRWKVEFAGNFLSLVTSYFNLEEDEQGREKIFGVAFSQYAKGEIEYQKHWQVANRSVFATRAFIGLALPYGNSGSMPFTRNYFAGGANDNRGWRAYDLGPGSSGSILDFNEANFKLAFNAELRFPLIRDLKGAIFADAGNIWNVLDDVQVESFRFTGIEDLTELALATGFGLRYDFGFFVFRLDIGFKTYDPGLPEGARWFKDYNFGNAVYNIGINYPF
ncbi:hypothetical protein BST85_01425 [Aureitalea marina]|uniref:Bacterial surface antigen (D15) domain-containing protein n=1 Tax=Aureitalea marina TaxID=930804 RepID=A0A2S7KTF3_9FLAO|nr:hypothetical protein BST85_01425 [Aureitalea marina]